ncbi:unnamed protein product [Danaus chrysippus]|uniref:(African queen) hypothetical protein n=1 Tax=Danaus chrysippus TaxID=151541 RepID=A0A8J2R4L3_9NEOP|nr:unnamed protein product [Danaus chrysippus]
MEIAVRRDRNPLTLSTKMLTGGNLLQILSGYNGIWVPTERDNIPAEAVVGGCTEYLETMFVGSAIHEKYIIPGKVVPSHKVCYVPYDGREIAKPKYVTLVTAS